MMLCIICGNIWIKGYLTIHISRYLHSIPRGIHSISIAIPSIPIAIPFYGFTSVVREPHVRSYVVCRNIRIKGYLMILAGYSY